jgi:hypothetical protein
VTSRNRKYTLRVRRPSWLAMLALIAAPLVVLSWVRSYGPRSAEPLSWRVRGSGRYSLRSERGWIVLLGPPPQPARETGDAAAWVGRVANADLGWRVEADLSGDGSLLLLHFAVPSYGANRGEAAYKLDRLGIAETTKPLMDALDDPQRFAVAHVWLARKYISDRASFGHAAGERILVNYHGLDVELVRAPPESGEPVSSDRGSGDLLKQLPPELHESTAVQAVRSKLQAHEPWAVEAAWQKLQWHQPFTMFLTPGPSIRIDPAQLPRIRKQWHDLLDVRLFAIPHALLVAVLLVPIAAVSWRWRRRRRYLAALGRNHCPGCGYDLRESRGRCPECGYSMDSGSLREASISNGEPAASPSIERSAIDAR